MLVVVLLVVLAVVAFVAVATMVAVGRDGHGAIAEDPAYDSRRPRL